MPDAVRGQDLSVMFFTYRLSKLGIAPTRLTKVLGCGLPVFANEKIRDVTNIIRHNRVGVIFNGHDPAQMSTALDELEKIMQDPELPKRYRATAEAIFSLEAGTEPYQGIYASIFHAEDSRCAE
jgi:uncharacterized protein (DUF111 family)